MHVTAAFALSATEHVEKSTIEVPLQRAYSGPKPVISSVYANTPCVNLGVDGLLHRLNTTLGTS